MDFSEFFPDYPQLDSADFSHFINKKEFDIDYSQRYIGGFFPHQLFMRRFFSGLTPYRKMLVAHGVGFGKSCLALAVAESVRTQSAFPFSQTHKKTLIIVKNSELERTFQLELLNQRLEGGRVYRTCPVKEYFLSRGEVDEMEVMVRLSSLLHRVDESNLPEVNTLFEQLKMETYMSVEAIYRDMNQIQRLLDNRRARIHRVGLGNISHHYDIISINKFINELNLSNMDVFVRKYSNSVIIVDEVHNIRRTNSVPEGDEREVVEGYEETNEETARERYDKLHAFLHAVKNSYTLLLSATPMVDKVSELAFAMNLILPQDLQLPMSEIGFSKMTDDELRRRFRGRVSYLRPSEKIDVRVTFQGERRHHFTLFNTQMSPFQSQQYRNLVGDDTTFSLTRSIKLQSVLNFALPPRGLSEVFGRLNGDVNIIKEYSSNYGKLIEYLLDDRHLKQKAFIFHQNINVNGVKTLVKILDRFGFSNYKRQTKVGRVVKRRRRRTALHGKDYMRYAILDSSISEKKRVFNGADNLDGKKIRIIIGTPMVSEGHSLMHVRSIHILAPWWNHTRHIQAIGRGIRALSHSQLKKEDRAVDVFLYNPVLDTGEDTFYTHMYDVAERKDVEIHNMIRLMKVESIDCENAKVINIGPTDQDYSQMCDYKPCDYNCSIHRDEQPLNQDSYNLYYAQERVEMIMVDITHLFRTMGRFSFGLDELIRLIGEESRLVLLALDKLTSMKSTYFHIQSSGYDVRCIDKYGFNSYIREFNNVYYLTPDISVQDPLTQTYSRDIVVKSNVTLKDALELYEMETDPHKLEKMRSALDAGEDAQGHLTRMSDEFKGILRDLIPVMPKLYADFLSPRLGLGKSNEEVVILYGRDLRGIHDGDKFKIFSFYNFKTGKFVSRKRDKNENRGIVCTSMGKKTHHAILNYIDADPLTEKEFIEISRRAGQNISRTTDGAIDMRIRNARMLCHRVELAIRKKGLMAKTTTRFQHVEDESQRPVQFIPHQIELSQNPFR
jgi:hypothetical protein